MKHIGLFAAGVLPPAASVLRHNLSTLSISLRRTSDLPPEAEQEVRASPSTSSAMMNERSAAGGGTGGAGMTFQGYTQEIGRASCRERV